MKTMRLLVGSRSQRWPLAALLCVICLTSLDPSLAQQIDTTRRSAGFPLETADGDKAAVSIASDQQMDFGQVADHDGSVVLGLADAITSDPSIIHYGGSPYSAICTITGDPSTAVDVSISATAANGLSLGTFTSSEGNIPLVAVNLDGTGELVLTIGATLTVDSAQANIGGGQSISYTITTTYN
jgi:hypothetical protein